MFGRILVSIDGSETSNLALKEALTLAKEQQASLRLVHVVDLTLAYTDLAAPYVLDYQKTLQAAGEKILADGAAMARAAGIPCDTRAVIVDRVGRHIADAIADEAKQWQADLIVIGTHGRRGVRRMLLGSVAEGVARIASQPVLLIRGAA
jgi:nucleotide-binding universal stress UspA family protein